MRKDVDPTVVTEAEPIGSDQQLRVKWEKWME